MLPSPGKRTLLVVEDDHALREMYRATLVAFGYQVVAVEDGIDALRYLEGHVPSLIVLDLSLPRLGGHDVQRELATRPETRDIPIVVVTGTDTRALPAADFDDVLKKPVTTDALVAAIERGLRAAYQSRPMSATVETRSRRAHGRARTVLVVDDEVAVRTLLRHFLEEKGYSIETAGSVGEAISVLERSIVDAVVLDVRMPRRSGLELLEFIRLDKRPHGFPVLILTGAALTPTEEAAIARKSAYVFYKSANLDALALQLNQLTG